jgi:hypothetical protein
MNQERHGAQAPEQTEVEMNTWSSRNFIRLSAIAVVLTIGISPGVWAQGSGWDFDLGIYGWLPTIEGKLAYQVPGIGDEIEVDPGTLIDNLQFTAMVAFAANHGKWSILGDVIYLKEAKKENTTLDIGPGVNLSADLKLEAWIVSLGGGYEVARGERSTLGLLVGARYFSTDSTLDLSADGPLETDVSLGASSTVWNGVVGVRGWLGLSDHWFVPYHLDIGAGDSDFTWQAYAGVGHEWKWGSLVLAYRYLDFDQGSTGDVRSLSMSGAELGVAFRF